ncbi:MAG: nodulation protein NfeD [Thermodesulfovibrionales bacterium]|jgi:membrane-bound serine protease (ClpP class)|nr:nodulation protein NfeD [Thermodesulfovibrionales bacterium]RJR10517.1 MAG: nodulation protein NfeD [Candidatus Parcubacteria bacterium]
MNRKFIFLALIFISTVLFLSPLLYSAQNKKSEVLVITVNGVINPVASEYIGKSIKKASEMNAEALIIELDTPGGLDTSMRSIVKDIIGSSVPVVVYVSPSGARAASAGVFITMAAHVAAMSPGTNIGAAHPVAMGGKMDKVIAEKATNDAAAYIKSIAESRGRNVKWAEDAVRKSVSVTETEALKNNIIDLIAKDINTLLSEIDGKKTTTAYGDKTLKTAGAKIIRHEMSFRHKILNLISDPNVAYILMMLGFYGLFFELTNPGAIFPGVIGGICLVLAFYSFQTLPVNYAGLLLIIIGLILFILEVKVTSYGMLTIGGIVSMVLGSLMLFESPLPFLKLSLSVIIPAAIVTALFFVLTFRLAYKAYKRKPVTGAEGMIGLEGVAKTDITPGGGMVVVHGEFWSAYSDDVIHKEERVVVEDVKGLRVKVKKSN